MVFNDTKVVPARLHFQRATGAHIEIFCLEPVNPPEYNTAFAATDQMPLEVCHRQCETMEKRHIVSLQSPCGRGCCGHGAQGRSRGKEWRDRHCGVHMAGRQPILQSAGALRTVPIPPYLNRETESIDTERYQTLYAHIRGSVAAPTAGLHFTQRVWMRSRLKE